MPTTSSGDCSQTGSRVWWLAEASRTASSHEVAIGIEIMSVRVVMICDTFASLSSITPSIMSRAAPSSLPSRCASSTTSRSSSCTLSRAGSPPRRPKALPRSVATPPSVRTAGEISRTSGRQSPHVATTNQGPASLVTTIGTTTSTSHTVPIQPAAVEASKTSDLPGPINNTREAISVAAAAASTTIDAAMKAIVSLPSTISS